ncbi:hypothetical protein L3Q82_021025 [Scortum barcoo]|uniref:Uncharacterized protein n=1 Tax=Scortum barcoo TaxID=214431 RepID=A0ACB8X383_9TELE|nr:hypothetical protein L3Q82_021025 [Scortum barcoo]
MYFLRRLRSFLQQTSADDVLPVCGCQCPLLHCGVLGGSTSKRLIDKLIDSMLNGAKAHEAVRSEVGRLPTRFAFPLTRVIKHT